MRALVCNRRVAAMLAVAIGIVMLAACGSDEPSAAELVSTSPGAVPVRVSPVTAGSISVTKAYAAIVESIDEVDVMPLAAGRIEKLTVGVGSEVRKGQAVTKAVIRWPRVCLGQSVQVDESMGDVPTVE